MSQNSPADPQTVSRLRRGDVQDEHRPPPPTSGHAPAPLTDAARPPRLLGRRRPWSRALRLLRPTSLLALWRSSLRTRVVVTVVVLCALVVGAVGWLMMRQLSQGLVDARVDASLAETRTEMESASERLDSAGASDFDSDTQFRQLVEALVSRGEVKGFDVVVYGPVDRTQQATSGVRSTPDVDLSSVPVALRSRVEARDGTAWTYTRLLHQGSARGTPGVAVGSSLVLPADGGRYAVYLLFPMRQEQDTLLLLRRVLFGAGLLLVALVGAVAWLVTRQVLTPVRLARRVAERIASGRLEERMYVSGEDDLARLATSFNQMAEALQSQIRKLIEVSRVQRTFVSDVSHELRTPLTTVRMASDVLYEARGSFDPVTARSAELLQNELDRFETMLTDLLEISRFDAGAAVLDLEPVDLVEVARRVVAACAPMAASREVPVAIESVGPCVVEADVRRIERVVRNLLTNAIDHAEGSAVTIRVAEDDDAAALTVRDRGVGLQPGQSAMVFNRFWRGDPARARTTGGTGLGLAIALEDARLHGGWLQAWGLPGQGTVFRLTVPRRAGDPLRHSPLELTPDVPRFVRR